jgi:hypothetical protein
MAVGAMIPISATPATHATGRQRRDGSRPVGNSSGSTVMKIAYPGAHIHVLSQAISGPAGRLPGRVCSA